MGKHGHAAPSRPAILVDSVPEIEIRGELVHFMHHDGSGEHYAMPIATCRDMHREMAEALISFETRPCAKLFKIKGHKRRHH